MNDSNTDEALGTLQTAQAEVKSIRHTALDLLARREHSRIELKRKLLKRFSNYAVVELVLDRLSSEKLQSDERYTENYVRYRSTAGFGPLRILAELRERGVNDSLSNRYLKNDSGFWQSQAQKAKQKKFGFTVAVDLNDRARQIRFLQYRGFSHSDIDQVLSTSCEAVMS